MIALIVIGWLPGSKLGGSDRAVAVGPRLDAILADWLTSVTCFGSQKADAQVA